MSEPTSSRPTSDAPSTDELLAELADDFARRYRRGEHPSLDEYARKHPSLADQIRDLFPAMLAMEQPDLTPPAERPGATVGRYKLLESIGEGGYGVVFMAEQTRPVKRKVALKIIKAGMDTRQVIARFEAERQALALMDHENIAKVFDAGTTDTGRLYFVMELVKGVPITKYCDEHHFTPRARLELFMQTCQAVQHAHQKGIIHRDLKPSNVLVALYDGKPVPKVIDFGVAKATGQQLTERTMFTGFGDVIGTPQYMSPEQAELNQLDIDTRSDIYALGVLLYELLTGTTPIEHKRASESALLEVLRVIREEEPPKPSTRLGTVAELPSIAAQRGLEPKKLAGAVHGELDWIVMKALEKDRNRRYETANGFARDVQRYLQDEAVLACPPSARYRLHKFARRHRAPLTVAAGFVLLLIAASVISSWLAVRATRAERQVIRQRDDVVAEKQQKETALAEKQDALAVASRNERTARERLAAGLRSLGDSQLKSAKGAEARESYWQSLDLAEQLGLSRWHAIAGLVESYAAEPPPLLGTDGRRPGVGGLTGHVAVPTQLDYFGEDMAVAFSPDGRMAATGGMDASVRLWDLATGLQTRLLSGHEGPVWDVKLSTDGRTLISGGDGPIVRLWDLASGEVVRTFDVSPAGAVGEQQTAVRMVDFSADGRTVLTAGSDLRLWDVDSGELVRTLNVGVAAAALSPDGRFALSGNAIARKGGRTQHSIEHWNLETGERIRELADLPTMTTSLAYFHDGRRAVSGNTNQTTTVWDLETGRAIQTFEKSGGRVLDVAVSGDDRFAVTASEDGTANLWEISTGKLIRSFSGHPARVRAVAISRDGRFILSGDPSVNLKLWNVQSDAEFLGSRPHAEQVSSVDISTDGLVALSGSFDRTVQLWDVPTGKTLRRFDGEAPVWSAALTRDARTALSGDGNGGITLWDLRRGERIRSVSAHEDTVTSISVSPDGMRALSASTDGTIKLWELADFNAGRELRTLSGHHPSTVRAVQFSPDGRTALSGSFDRTMRLWDLASGSEIRRFDAHEFWVMAVAFSPDGRTAASLDFNGLFNLWDVASGNNLFRSPVVYASPSLAFSPAGDRVLTAGYNGEIDLWDVAARGRIRSCRWHDERVIAVAFCPDGQTVLAGYDDGTLIRPAFDRPDRYRQFEQDLPVAREVLARDPNNPEALTTFARWYAFRGVYDWAAELFERARAAGGDVSGLDLARCYWQLDKRADAAREFRGAIQRQEAPAGYLTLCLKAVEDPQSNKAATTQTVERTGLRP